MNSMKMLEGWVLEVRQDELFVVVRKEWSDAEVQEYAQASMPRRFANVSFWYKNGPPAHWVLFNRLPYGVGRQVCALGSLWDPVLEDVEPAKLDVSTWPKGPPTCPC